MDRHLAHSEWRVVHTDAFTPDAFLARLALEGYAERPLTIQMALEGEVTDRGAAIELHAVATDADWDDLLQLAIADHTEGRRTGDLELSHAVSAGLVAGYRAKSHAFPYFLVIKDGAPVAYGAFGVAPNGVGMIEDLFTLPAFRRQGIATGVIVTFVDRMRQRDCRTLFLGALAEEAPKDLYARLGFQPVGLARAWVRAANPSSDKGEKASPISILGPGAENP
jgi:GNAT superfamily N-acetyltransferase